MNYSEYTKAELHVKRIEKTVVISFDLGQLRQNIGVEIEQ